MPRLARASNKNRRSQSRVAQAPSSPQLLAETKDTYVPIDDLVEGAVITGPAAGRPALSVMWPEEMNPEFVQLLHRALHHFAQLGLYNPKTRQFRTKKSIIEAYFKEQRLSNGEMVSPTKAEYLAMFCLPVKRLKGGPIPNE
jgi:hypothetical protein